MRSPKGHECLAVLTGWPYERGRVNFHDWSKLSDVLKYTSHMSIRGTDIILKN